MAADRNGKSLHKGHIVWLPSVDNVFELGEIVDIDSDGWVQTTRLRGDDYWSRANDLEIVELPELKEMLDSEEEPEPALVTRPLVEIHIHDQ